MNRFVIAIILSCQTIFFCCSEKNIVEKNVKNMNQYLDLKLLPLDESELAKKKDIKINFIITSKTSDIIHINDPILYTNITTNLSKDGKVISPIKVKPVLENLRRKVKIETKHSNTYLLNLSLDKIYQNLEKGIYYLSIQYNGYFFDEKERKIESKTKLTSNQITFFIE